MFNKVKEWSRDLYFRLKNISIYNEKNHREKLSKYPRKSKLIRKRLKAHEARQAKIDKEKISKIIQAGEKVDEEEKNSLLEKENKENKVYNSIKRQIDLLEKEQKTDLEEIENEISTRNVLYIAIFLFMLIIGIILIKLSFLDIDKLIENNNGVEFNLLFFGIPLVFISSSIMLEIIVKNNSDKFYFIQYILALLIMLLNSALDLDNKIEIIIIFIIFIFSFSLWFIFVLFKVIDGLRMLHNSLVLSIENPNERVTIYISIVGSVWATILLFFN